MKLSTYEVINIVKSLDNIMQKDLEMTPTFQWLFIDNYDELKKVSDKHDRLVAEMLKPYINEGKFEIDSTGKITPKEEYKDEFEVITRKVNEFLGMESEIGIKLIPRSETPKGLTIQDITIMKFMFE